MEVKGGQGDANMRPREAKGRPRGGQAEVKRSPGDAKGSPKRAQRESKIEAKIDENINALFDGF